MQDKVEIVSNNIVGEDCFRMALNCHLIVKDAKPGQFVHIRPGAGNDPLLRRPMSIHSVDDRDTFSVLYRVTGQGTAMLAELKAGNSLDVIGPLGAGFTVDKKSRRAILVGGGIGAAPLLYLAQSCLAKQMSVIILLGASTRDSLLAVADFKALGCVVKVTTEDGSAGVRGYVTDLLEPALMEGAGPVAVFACGPVAMMHRAGTMAGIYDVPCQVSLEERMACGVGACLGCVVATEDGYRRVCADGPVFNAGEIEWPD